MNGAINAEGAGVLQRLTHAHQILAEVRTLPEAKDLFDVAVAAEVYAKQRQLGEEAERYAREIRLRSERKIGEILSSTPKNPGAKGIGTSAVPIGNHTPPTLKDLGFTKKFSMLAQKLASLSEEEFEEFATGIRDAKTLKQRLNQPKQRKENDFYPTAAPLVTGLLDHVHDILPNHRVLEPCAGDGAMWQILSQRQSVAVAAGDIAPQFDECFQWDATNPDDWEKRDWELEEKLWAQDWTITNPPFNAAEAILDLAYRHSRIGVAMLLRLSFLEPCNGRAHWLEDHANELRYAIPVNPRPQFRDDTKSTDNSTVVWLVWLKGWSWEKDLKIAPPFQFIRNWR